MTLKVENSSTAAGLGGPEVQIVPQATKKRTKLPRNYLKKKKQIEEISKELRGLNVHKLAFFLK